jgi:hypothetical protein
MRRSVYFDYIEEKLNTLASRVESRGKLNILDLHIHSENFYLHLLNKLYGWDLKNLNKILKNVEAIDLIDHTNKCIIQVSATSTKEKVESALEKETIKKYCKYNFKFVSISKPASKLRSYKYTNPNKIKFIPTTDILDKDSILNDILSLSAPDQKKIYLFIKDELGNDIDIVKLDSNLAIIINILSKEDLDDQDQSSKINSFEIDRKISFNDLDSAKYIIEDYKIYYDRLDKKYAEFDSLGVNKSSSVLAAIRREYLRNCSSKTADELFYCITDNIQNRVVQSSNYVNIPIDELELCVNILVVDAFIRCKIFKNPRNYNYVTT